MSQALEKENNLKKTFHNLGEGISQLKVRIPIVFPVLEEHFKKQKPQMSCLAGSCEEQWGGDAKH